MSGRPAGRILMLLENNPYPEDSRVSHEALALRAAGYEVTVISVGKRGQPRYEVCDGVHVHRFPPLELGEGVAGYAVEYAYATLATLALSVRVLASRGFDVVHAHNPPDTYALVGGLYKLLGKRFVFDHHDLAPEMYRARLEGGGSRVVHRVLLALERLSLRLADHVVAANESYRLLDIERGRVPGERITVVRNGPDLRWLGPVEPDRTLVPAGRRILGYAGVIGRQDGVDRLLVALHHLVHELGRGDVAAVVVGDGDALADLRRLAAELALGEHVRFTGWLPRERCYRTLAASEVCVVPDPSNPYTDRSTMIKLMDYMALGKPIAAFDLPEHRRTAGDAAAYATANDERALAGVIAELLDDPARCAAMGAVGRERVERELAWPHSVPHLLRAYERVLAPAGALARA